VGNWNRFFGSNKNKKADQSPYLPESEDPIDIQFAKLFSHQGGRFLYSESEEIVNSHFEAICKENQWSKEDILIFNTNLSQRLQLAPVETVQKKLTEYKTAFISCEYLISNTGALLLCDQQIKHYKLNELPDALIIFATTQQFVQDVSEGMSLLKGKYDRQIPSNITTVQAKNPNTQENISLSQTANAKNIYLLLQDISF